MKYIGNSEFPGIRDEDKYYWKDNTYFIESDDIKCRPMSEKELEMWAIWLNSPWSQEDEKYSIQCNCKDAYTKMESPFWKCTYSIIGYEGVSASVVGYGDTEEEALSDCKKRFEFLQKNYNKEEESF